MAVKPARAHGPLVVAIDIGSSATRTRIVDATGTPVSGTRQRVAHAIVTGTDGSAVIEPDLILREVEQSLDTLLANRAFAGRIAGVAMDTFALSAIAVDSDDHPVTPCFTYADSRPAEQVTRLRAELDEAAVQQRTGCRLSTSYLPARLRWLRDSQPEVAARVVRWLSLGEYIYARLLKQYAVSYSTAAWSGLLDRRTAQWDAELLEACGGHPDQFSPLHDTTEPLTIERSEAARRWPALAAARWFPAVADGYASNVGSGAIDGGTLALAAGTSGAVRALLEGAPETVPPGLWCYRVDRERSLLGGALNDVGRLAAWLRDHLRLPDGGALNTALLAPPLGATPLVLPFLTGERSPGWAASARATFTGVSDATTALDLWRGAMESLALRYALIVRELGTSAPAAARVLASGGVTEITPGWLQIVADALGRPVTRVARRQATLRGTALIALDVLAPDVLRAPVELSETYQPNPAHRAHYDEALHQQERLYSRLVAERQDP